MWTFVGKVMCLLFNMLSISVIDFLPRSKHLLISWLQSPSTVILELKKIKSVTVSIFPPIYLPWSGRTGGYDSHFLNCWVLSQTFHSLLSPSSGGSLVSLHFLLFGWYLRVYLRLLIFPPAILIPACASSSPAFCVWLFASPWTAACKTLLSMEFSRQEYWSGFSFPSPSLQIN